MENVNNEVNDLWLNEIKAGYQFLLKSRRLTSVLDFVTKISLNLRA